jgi:peptidyl-prolyl cis-trans isomerase B (cyclophilin B)
MTDQNPVPTPAAQPAAPAYAPAAPGAKWNVLAIVSLVTSLLWISLVGIITGHIALSQIKKTGEQGHGVALAGTIIGYVGLLGGIIVGIFWIVLFAAAAASGSYNY